MGSSWTEVHLGFSNIYMEVQGVIPEACAQLVTQLHLR